MILCEHPIRTIKKHDSKKVPRDVPLRGASLSGSVRKFRRLSHIYLVALTLVLGACSETAVETPPIKTEKSTQIEDSSQKIAVTKFDPKNFTTKGRPTKIIETPWGGREVYDLSQDIEILDAIEEIYERGDVFYGDVHKVSPYKPVKADSLYSVRLVRHARNIQNLDMMRLGCRWTHSVPCQLWTSPALKSPCNDTVFGSAQFSKCEINNIIPRRFFGGPVLKGPKGQGYDDTAYPYDIIQQCTIDGIEGKVWPYTKVGKTYGDNTGLGLGTGYTLGETKRLLTIAECAKWSSNNEFSNIVTGEK